MSLILWTGADAKALKEIVGPAVAQGGCKHRVVADVTKFPAHVGPADVVLGFGSKAVATLQALGLVPKNRTIGSLREKPIKHNGTTVLVTYDPNICYRDYARQPEVQWDIQLASRLHQTGSTKPQIGEYRYVESLHELIERIEEKYEQTQKQVDLACDLETKSLNPYDPAAWIISASFTVDEGKSDVLYFERGEAPVQPLPWKSEGELDYWEGLWTQIHWILTTDKVSLRGANFKYDSTWIHEKWGIYCTNHRFDTMLVGSLLDENRSNSLKLHAKLMTPMGGYEDDMDKYDFGSLEVVPKSEMLNYVGGDTDATYRVAIKMKADLLGDKRLANFYVKLLHPASKAFEKMERNGVLVDVPYYHQLQTELEAEIARLQSEMLKCMPNKMRIKYKDDIQGAFDEGKSPFKPSILKEFLFTPSGLNLKPQVFTEKTGEPSTSMDHLMMFESDPIAANFISLFRELGSASKTLSTYVIGFLKHLRPDNRFHATYMLHRGGYGGGDSDSGTVTGRCLTAEARILTDKGEITIKELVERGEQGEEFKVLTHRNRWLPVTGFWRNGLKPVCTVRALGHSLTSTYNHPYMSFPSWTLAEDLKPGSWLYAVVEPPKVEEWRPIQGWPFEVSSMGRVRRDPMTGFAPIRVDSVADAGVQETFDLTVDEDHSFVANGLVVHNTSAKDPAVQTVPKHSKWAKRLRRAYIAPPGKVIIQCDFSQGELRICAVVAEEPIMTQAYASGADLHAITAAQLNGYTFEDFMLLPEDTRDALRSGGKAGNFGLIYGMQHKGFRDYAYTTYGVSMTEEEAFQKRGAFFDLYNRLPAWHDEYKEHAHRWGFVRSPLGRVRHLPLINSKDREVVAQSERQAINSPIQSCLSDMMQLAMVHIDREYGDADIQMFMMTHDSLALYVPEDDAVEWARRVKYIMENLPLERDFGWHSPLKFIADAEVSMPDDNGVRSLATLKKMKGL